MKFFYKFASLSKFYSLTEKLAPIFLFMSVGLFCYGLIGGLYLAPPDYQQGDGFRIIYVHVPCAFMSLLIYVNMAAFAFIAQVWKIKLADLLTKAAAPIGASFTFLALITGAIWGKPMWGTFWIWDARLTSELILLFLYMGYILLQYSLQNAMAATKAGRIVVLVGVINIPIIHYSVYWWNTLHQGSTITRLHPSIAPSMLYPLLAMIAAFLVFYLGILLVRVQSEILLKEQKNKWVRNL